MLPGTKIRYPAIYLSALHALQMGDATTTGDEQHIKETVLHCNIRGSLQQFHSGGSEGASWSPVAGRAGDVFGVNDFFDTHPDVGQTTNVLQNTLLHEVQILSVQNDFPINLGVSISCIPGDEMTKTGNRFAMTALAHSTTTNPETVYSSESSQHEGIEWRQKYPTYNANNLDSTGVLQVVGQPYVFVSQNHPVIDLLRTNADKLNARIDDQPLIDGEWYKVTKQVMGQCCNVLRSKVLNKVSTRDMNDFVVQLHRIGSSDWVGKDVMHELASKLSVADELNPSGSTHHKSKILEKMTSKPYQFTARIRVKYEINVPNAPTN